MGVLKMMFPIYIKNDVPDLHQDSNDDWNASNITGYLRSAMVDVGCWPVVTARIVHKNKHFILG